MATRAGVGLVGRFLGNAVSEAAAFAAGVALGPVLGPPVQALRNEVNAAYPLVPIDPGLLAQGVAQGQIGHDVASEIASHSGINAANFDHMVEIFDTGPGIGQAFDLWRRGIIGETGFRRAVKREGLEDEWIDDLVKIHDQLLTPSELANAVVQGHMSQDDAAAEAAKQGVSADRFAVMVQNTGLPPGPETLLAWLRRGIITRDEFEQGIREGHTKVKYIAPYEEALHPILSPAEYAGLALRGWIGTQQMYDGGALSGMTPEQMDLLYRNRGRPATVHQIHIGYARGASVPGASNEEEAIRQAVRRSNVRTEYQDVLYASRYTLPSWFALRALLTGGAITETRAATLLKQSGWPPDLADEVAAFYAHPMQTTGTVNPRVKRAQDQVYNAAHSSYLNNEIDRARAIATLERIGLDATTAGVVVDLWEVENDVLVKPLTPSAIKKAYGETTFTLDDAVARLVAQQWTAADAQVYLQS